MKGSATQFRLPTLFSVMVIMAFAAGGASLARAEEDPCSRTESEVVSAGPVAVSMVEEDCTWTDDFGPARTVFRYRTEHVRAQVPGAEAAAGYQRYDLSVSEPQSTGESTGRFVFVHVSTPAGGTSTAVGAQADGRSDPSGSSCGWGPVAYTFVSLLGINRFAYFPVKLAPCEGPHRVDDALLP